MELTREEVAETLAAMRSYYARHPVAAEPSPARQPTGPLSISDLRTLLTRPADRKD
jgi:hypothetical protein